MIIYKYLLKKLIPPFLFSTLTLTFIFLLQFLMKTADRLIGKGLSTWIVIKLIAYNLTWMVVLVIPMAVLVTVLMAFGSLTQDNEFAVLKSSGVSLIKLMLPVFFVSGILCYFLIQFNNNVLPDANFANKSLMYEISRVKPTLSLESNVFSNELNNLSILARKVSKENNELFDILIYDYTIPQSPNTITAQKGNLFFTKDNKKLIFVLEFGEIHQLTDPLLKTYRRTFFKRHQIALDASQFLFQQGSVGIASRGDREMSSAAMRIIVDSLQFYRDSLFENVKKNIKGFNSFIYNNKFIHSSAQNNSTEKVIIERVMDNLRIGSGNISNEINRITYYDTEADQYLVEIYKKYSIPFACIVFVLIGAPLGVLTRKGSFGMAAGISLIFFLIYWACLIGGEKLADRQLISPLIGMWVANIIMGIAGVFLTYKMNKEQIVIDFSWMNKLIPKFIRQSFEQQEITNENSR